MIVRALMCRLLCAIAVCAFAGTEIRGEMRVANPPPDPGPHFGMMGDMHRDAKRVYDNFIRNSTVVYTRDDVDRLLQVERDARDKTIREEARVAAERDDAVRADITAKIESVRRGLEESILASVSNLPREVLVQSGVDAIRMDMKVESENQARALQLVAEDVRRTMTRLETAIENIDKRLSHLETQVKSMGYSQ